MSVSGALPEKSESFRFAAYGRKPTAVADGLQDMLSRDASIINRELGPPALIMDGPVASPTRSSPPRHPAAEGPIYGELVVLGTNGRLRCPALSPKMKSRFLLRRQPKATGVSPSIRQVSEEHSTPGAYMVSVTLPKLQTCVTEFEADPDTDLFQVGRSADQCINYVVVETEVKEGREQYKANSTVSRYACRILCERKPPYTARIYAAAFDTNKKIKLSTMAPTWVTCEGSDGLTTNGVVLMHPQGYFEPGVEGGAWQEVTVMGNIRKLRVKRSSRSPGEPLHAETNILTDGCLIDLCGVTLMWRSAMGLEQAPTRRLITQHLQELNQGAMHCPVGLQTLYLPTGSKAPQPAGPSAYVPERHPWVYLACGHVHGPHEWRAGSGETDEQRTCPICREVGPFVRLYNGEERSYCLDMQPPTHAFVPCGHMCSVNTAKYWSSVPIQYSIDKWGTVCPFCRTPLSQANQGPGYIKLIFA